MCPGNYLIMHGLNKDSMFYAPREGALKKKFRNFCLNAGLTTTHLGHF
jgi:hypothetical protein